jgi:hypothetical protein
MNHKRSRSTSLLLLAIAISLMGCAKQPSQTNQTITPSTTPRLTPEQVGLRSLQNIPEPVTLLATEKTLYVASAPCPYGNGCSFIYAMPIEGGEPTRLNQTSFPCTISGLVLLSNTGAIAAGRSCGALTSVDLNTGEWKIIWEGEPLVRPARMVKVGEYIYIADIDGGPDSSGAIFRVPVTGGRPTLVVQGLPLVDPTGITATPEGDVLYICDQNGPQGAEPRPHSDPGGPGMIFKLSIADPSRPNLQLIAQGGNLKNPIGIELIGDTLYVGDEGATEDSPQGIYKFPVANVTPNSDVRLLTQSITALYAGSPFVEPIGLASLNGKLYVADDRGNTIFTIPVTPEPSPMRNATPSGTGK